MSLPRALLLFGALLLVAVSANEGHKYKVGEDTHIWVHSVGPFNNPNEIYNYYSLPLCRPKNKQVRLHAGLAESLLGYELVQSQVKIQFRMSADDQEECTQTLSSEDVAKLSEAVRQQYWYQWFYDDLPVWGALGATLRDPATDAEAPYVYTHREISVSFGEDNRVVEVTLNSSALRPLDAAQPLRMTYSVRWAQSALGYEERFDRYLDRAFFEHQIHWFSLFNTLMLAVFLLGVVVMIMLRTVHRDMAKAEDVEEAKDDMSDESGWKQVAGDVFRAPEHPVALSSAVGVGFQLAVLLLCLFVVAYLGTAYIARGRLLSWFIALYAIASVLGGYKSGSLYASTRGKAWIRTALVTSAAFPAAMWAGTWVLSSVAASQDSMAAVHFGSQVALASVWAFIVLPLTFVGTLAGRHFGLGAQPPRAVAQFPQPIPERSWYEGRTACIALGGLLPFGSVFIEMYFVFAGLWHYKYYYVYGFLLLVYVVLLVVAACVNVIATYYLLNTEDHRWQWASFWTGASTGAYALVYSAYYFSARTMMTGALQTTFFFAITGAISAALALICGAVGFIASAAFVQRIYATGKTE